MVQNMEDGLQIFRFWLWMPKLLQENLNDGVCSVIGVLEGCKTFRGVLALKLQEYVC